jgi:hypothetical protein
MTLVYRAVWEDDSAEPLRVLEDEFKEWCTTKGVDPDDIPRRGRHTVSESSWIDVRRADVEAGRALQCTHAEVDNRGRTWTTTATALVDSEANSFWVDLDCHDPNGGRPDMAAPRLVRGLIANGGRPMAFGEEVRTTAKRTMPAGVNDLVDHLVDGGRQVPVVVFSPDARAHPSKTLERADATAATLAGIAHVYVLTPQACEDLNRMLPEGFGVFSGAVRLYLPGLQADDPDDRFRHRFFPVRQIAAHPRRAASMLAGRLARLQIHPPIPRAWDQLGALLRRPSDEAVGTRAAEIATERRSATESDDLGALRAEIDALTKLLAEADLIREELERDAAEQITSLEASVATAEAERFDDADELEELRRERDALQRNMRLLAQPPGLIDESPDDPHQLAVPESIADAIELAQERLTCVVIPDEALRDIDELDGTAKYQVWGSTIWQGLLALNEYARTKAAGVEHSGFKLWCEATGDWPVSKLAMTESDRVQNEPKFRDQRSFVVDPAVSPSGRVLMFAHLKIQAGGGDNIPRLYFHDDTDGPTGKMHVGFIGPHRHVRNTRS